MSQTEQLYRRLSNHVQQLASADSAAATFQALLTALPEVAPRGAMLLVRDRRAIGWQAWGHDAEGVARVGTLDHEIDDAHHRAWLSGTRFDETASEIGQLNPGAAERLSISLRAESHPIGVIVLERTAQESWSPSLLEILRTVAELQLEVALIRKRAATQAAAPAPTVTAAPTASAPEPIVDDPIAPDPVGLSESDAAPADADPALEAARRFARLVATDIRLYNEEAVLQGRKHRDLLERLSEHINRGRETFVKRHGALGDSGLQILHEAYVQVLAGGDDSLLPPQADS